MQELKIKKTEKLIEIISQTRGIGKELEQRIRKNLINNKIIKKLSLEEVGFPNEKYDIIYADPPWHYNDKSKSHGGGAENHYPTMKLKEIKALPIEKISKKNSTLFLWTTFPQLDVAFKVIKAWGFEYKTGAFIWVKTNKDGSLFMGMGRHTRANSEVCLLASRGKGLNRKRADILNTQLEKRLRHSKKPDKFRKLIEQLYGFDKKKIELFARQKSKGWDVWGNEV